MHNGVAGLALCGACDVWAQSPAGFLYIERGRFDAKRAGARTVEVDPSHVALISHPLEIARVIQHLATTNEHAMETAMEGAVDDDRRRFVSDALKAVGAFEILMLGAARAQTTEPAAAPAARSVSGAPFPSVKQVDAGALSVGYAEAGPTAGPPVLLLHGWPYDIHSFVDVVPLLASMGYRVIVPYLRGYGTTRFLSPDTMRNGQQSAVASDMVSLMDALNLGKATVAGFDWGARTACILAAIWPERVKSLVAVSGYLIGSPKANRAPLPPEAELAWWYQYYFVTERGRDGYAKYRRAFNKLIWQTASPKWAFDEATFDRSAGSFDNPDHVDIVVHNYRWRLGLAAGESTYDALEARLAALPRIVVPTITLEGDANGAPHAEPSAYAGMFTGNYAHRLIRGGIGHNLPQEAPREFADAVIAADRGS